MNIAIKYHGRITSICPWVVVLKHEVLAKTLDLSCMKSISGKVGKTTRLITSDVVIEIIYGILEHRSDQM